MDANQTIVAKLLQDTRPTGFSADQTIRYGILSTGFLEERVIDSSQYPQGTNDPAYLAAKAAWIAKYGKDLKPMLEAQMLMVDQAFAAIGKLVGVTFVRDDANAQIRFGTADTSIWKTENNGDVAGFNTRRYTGNAFADVNAIVISNSLSLSALAPGNDGFVTLMHEIEHALGVDHPGSYVKGNEIYAGQEDNAADTIMSYRTTRPYTNDQAGYGSVLQDTNAITKTLSPARYDILALQQLLGKNTATQGNDTQFNGFHNSKGSETFGFLIQ